jgi:hypothetical protein
MCPVRAWLYIVVCDDKAWQHIMELDEYAERGVIPDAVTSK